MARRLRVGRTPGNNARFVLRAIPWKVLLLLALIVVLAIPTYLFGARLGGQVLPAINHLFDSVSAPPPSPTPTPQPALPQVLPRSGSILYTVQNGDSCDSMLTFQMRMSDAGQVFSDVKPETVKALNATLGKDCHALQPGMSVLLSPHYPLIAFGGIVQKIEATTPQQVLPTPLIHVSQKPLSADCSGGCNLTVRLTPQVQVHLLVQTKLEIHQNSWVWAQAMLARKHIQGFDTYPYADPSASLDGMSLHACDFQVDNTHDDNSLSCAQISPNTMNDDDGAWLFGVTGPPGLDHWGYPLKFPSGTRVLLWLSFQKGDLKFRSGNPVYRYDEGVQRYVKA